MSIDDRRVYVDVDWIGNYGQKDKKKDIKVKERERERRDVTSAYTHTDTQGKRSSVCACVHTMHGGAGVNETGKVA